MKYVSTRQLHSNTFTFEEVVLQGLASDGGLYVPESIPQVSLNTLISWSDLTFAELALEIFQLYIDESEIPKEDLSRILKKSFDSFHHSQITPLVKLPLQDRFWVLELFHGPTFAFKDVALQVLGNLFEYFLERKRAKDPKNEHKLTILGGNFSF